MVLRWQAPPRLQAVCDPRLRPARQGRRPADLQPVRRLPPGRVVVLRTLIAAGLVAAGVAGAQPQSGLVVGHSVRGRGIVAYERGDRSAPVTLVFGVIHGTEPAGLAVI